VQLEADAQESLEDANEVRKIIAIQFFSHEMQDVTYGRRTRTAQEKSKPDYTYQKHKSLSVCEQFNHLPSAT